MNLKNNFEFRKGKLFHYSPYSFLRSISHEKIIDYFVKSIQTKIDKDEIKLIEIEVNNESFYFLIEFLQWDTDYFGVSTYKIHLVLYSSTNYRSLIEAVAKFSDHLINQKIDYCFTEIPSEDIHVLQAFTNARFKLIETRMTYFLDLKNLNQPRYAVREANESDIDNLKRVASEMRNEYDRFHADPVSSLEKADSFLATYVDESIKGLADVVLVPNEISVPPDAFLTAKYLKTEWNDIGSNVSKMVLSAVSAETCKGWYKKLISEMAFHLRDRNAEFAFMHPASTNRAVIHTYETLGCKLGQVTHILSKQII